MEDVLIGASASVATSWVDICDILGTLYPSEGGMSSFTADKSSTGNFPSLLSPSGFDASRVMMASGWSYLFGAAPLGSLTGCLCFLRPIRACELDYTSGFPSVGRNVLKKSS